MWHQDFGLKDVYLRRYDSDGNAQGAEVRVNTYTFHNQFTPSVAAPQDGGFVVTWTSFQEGSGWGVYMKRYSAMGIAEGAEP